MIYNNATAEQNRVASDDNTNNDQYATTTESLTAYGKLFTKHHQTSQLQYQHSTQIPISAHHPSPLTHPVV